MSVEQIGHYVEIFVAGALCVGAFGTALEALGNAVKYPVLVKLGQTLEDFAANIPRLLGKENPRS